MKAPLHIPKDIIMGLHKGTLSLKEAAEKLQKHVLEFEWIYLPAAVRASARKIIVEKGQGR